MLREFWARASRGGAPLAPGRWSLRDAAAPEMVAVRPDHLLLADGRVACSVAVRGYPREVDANWLECLFGLDGEMRISQHIEPLDQQAALAELDRDLRAAGASLLLADLRGTEGDPLDRVAAQDARALRQSLARGEVRMFRHHLVLTLFASDLPELSRRCEALLAYLHGRMLVGRRVPLQQQDAFAATMPLGQNTLAAPRNLDSDALAASLPLGGGEFADPDGDWWGVDLRRRTAVLLDRFRLPNPHSIALGGSGSGKSFCLKHILTQHCLAGGRVAILDPQGEYAGWCRALGGAVIRLGTQAAAAVNPLAWPAGGDIAAEAWPAIRAERTRALLDLLAGPAARAEPSVVWAALESASARTGGRPTLRALADELLGRRGASARLGQRLDVALRGGLRAFAGAGGDDAAPVLGGTALVFDLRDVVGQSEVEAAAAYLLLTHHVLDQLVRPDAPPLSLAVDEAHHLLAQPVGARFLEVLFRSGRKRGIAVWLATQSVGDLLGADAHPEAARAARAALANAAVVLLMRQQNGRETDWLRELYRLDRPEAEWLALCPVGHGLLIAGARRAMVRVEAPSGLLPLFSSDPPATAARAR